ncbi:glyco_like_mftF, transferase 2, rSAM/selenodomain-associated [Candidatus Nanopelagicaceae bacterium]
MTAAISCLLPIKNGSKFISSIKDSITRNLSESDEVIVVDDNSTDDTSLKLANWAKEDSRIRVLHNPKSGLVSALNFGISESKNNWIARFDADDFYAPDRLLLQRRAINHEVVAIFTDYSFTNAKGARLGSVVSAVSSNAVELSLYSANRTPHPSALFNREAVISVGSYLQSEYLAEDLGLWFRLSKVGKLISIPKILLGYRISATNISAVNGNGMRQQRDRIIQHYNIRTSLINEILEDLPDIFSLYSNLEYTSRRKALLLRDLIIAQKNFPDSIESSRLTREISKAMLLNPDIPVGVAAMGIEKFTRSRVRKVRN